MPAPVMIDALGPNGSYRARNRRAVEDVTGRSIGELSLVPPVFVTRAISALRASAPMAAGQRRAALTRAADIFASGKPGGMPVAEYESLVSRLGTPISHVRAAVEAIRSSAESAHQEVSASRPAGAVGDWREPGTREGSAVWIRRGDVFAVHTAGNHPAVNALWLEALALGYRVALRPSQREPLTPFRLVQALREAGFGDDQVMLLPTDHAVADQILAQADLGMVYGGQETVDKYGANPNILPNGPGRSKILITADSDWRAALDMIVDSVVAQGGVTCVNATAVYVEGDPTEAAAALAERLAVLPSLPPQDSDAVLPVQSAASAHALAQYLGIQAEGARAVLGADGVVDELGDGSAVLRPAVHVVDSPFAPQLGIELSFPSVWVAPWNRQAGTKPFRDSLVVTAVTQDVELFETLLTDPSIRNLYQGHHPTHWMAVGVPHDGFLGEFLMRSKGVITSPQRPGEHHRP